jgi:hypothetical protein
MAIVEEKTTTPRTATAKREIIELKTKNNGKSRIV